MSGFDLEPHWLWMLAAILLGIAELIVPGVFLIWLAAAAAATGLLTLAFGIGLPFQFALFALISIAAVYFGRRWYIANPMPSADPLLNDRAARLTGRTVVVVAAIANGEGRSRSATASGPAAARTARKARGCGSSGRTGRASGWSWCGRSRGRRASLVGGRHQFRYARTPPLSDYWPTIAMLLLALPLTAVAWVLAVDPDQRSGSLLEGLAILLIVAASWWVASLFARAIWRRRSAFRTGEAAVQVDELGLTVPGLIGKPINVPWAQVEAMDFEERKGRHFITFRARSLSGSVPVDDLDAPPAAVWEAIDRSWRRSA